MCNCSFSILIWQSLHFNKYKKLHLNNSKFRGNLVTVSIFPWEMDTLSFKHYSVLKKKASIDTSLKQWSKYYLFLSMYPYYWHFFILVKICFGMVFPWPNLNIFKFHFIMAFFFSPCDVLLQTKLHSPTLSIFLNYF